MTRGRTYVGALIITLSALVQVPGLASAQGPSEKADKTALDPEAMAALNRMGAYLRTLTAFQVRAEATTEEVLVDGQKVQFGSVTDFLTKKPNRFRVNVNSDRQERLFLYDGKAFTLWAPRTNYYATVAAPSTIEGVLDQLEEKHGIELPLVDLFRWGGPKSSDADITVATDVGPSQIGGTTVQHYAFRQPGLDWQIWIQLGDHPLPRKLVATTTEDEARPQFAVVYTWNLAPSFNDAAFTFDPPTDAKKIVLAEVKATADSVKAAKAAADSAKPKN